MNEEEEIPVEEPPKSILKNPLLWTIIFIIAVLVLFFIVFNFSGGKQYPAINYEGHEFYKIENMWYTQLQFGDKMVTLPLRFNPLEVQNVKIHGKLSDAFNRKDIYITFDPRNRTGANFTILALGAAELSLSLAKAMEINVIAACAYDVPEVCGNRPIVSCDEKNKSAILISDIGTPEILLYKECVVLKGHDIGLLKSIDRFLYQWYRIMKD